MQIVAAPKTSTYTPVPFANVRSLLHFNTYPFVDSSSYARTINDGTGGSALRDTSAPLYGAGSLLTNGSSFSGVSLNCTGYNFDLVNGFCIEAVIRIASYISGHPLQIIGCWVDGANYFSLRVPSNGGIGFFNFQGGVLQGVGSNAAGLVTLNTTHHIAAVVLPGGAQKLFVDGVDVTAGDGVPFTNPIRQTDSAGNRRFTIGHADNGASSPFWYSNARIDELRIVNGLPVYTKNFTPRLPHPDS